VRTSPRAGAGQFAVHHGCSPSLRESTAGTNSPGGREPGELKLSLQGHGSLGRRGNSGALLFLAAKGASYITGSIITVDGGTSASTRQPHI
jgi:NAD(P)-dependent dehydrogenase (short-subunit alcohol dehydrogenase family)